MKNNDLRKVLFFLVMTFCIMSCQKGNNAYTKQLNEANRIMDECQDSAKYSLAIINRLEHKFPNMEKWQQQKFWLLKIKAQKKLGQNLKSDSIIKSVAAYYDKEGSPNEKLEAFYLLGSTYRDINDAPKAIGAFYDAISKADTTDLSCDYNTIGMAYMQIALLYGRQGLIRENLNSIDLAVKNMLLAKDTLCAINYYAYKNSSYIYLNKLDSAILVNDKASLLFEQYGDKKSAAVYYGKNFGPYTDKGEYKKARKAMEVYERYSGMFSNGEIKRGAETYYYKKGKYFLCLNELDSAEYYFRKEQRLGKDFNNKVASSWGLAQVYKKRNNSDSIAKYATLCYEFKDSLYNEEVLTTIMRMRNLFDYSSSNKEAFKNAQKVNRVTLFCFYISIIFVSIIVLLIFLVNKYISTKKKEIFKLEGLYSDTAKELLRAQNGLKELELKDADRLNQLREEKEEEIQKLQQQLNDYKPLIIGSKDELLQERELQDSLIRKRFEYISYHIAKLQPTEDEWKQLIRLVEDKIPTFRTVVLYKTILSENEYKVCILVRLKFKASEIADFVGISRTSVTLCRKRLLLKIFGISGSAGDFDKHIYSIK